MGLKSPKRIWLQNSVQYNYSQYNSINHMYSHQKNKKKMQTLTMCMWSQFSKINSNASSFLSNGCLTNAQLQKYLCCSLRCIPSSSSHLVHLQDTTVNSEQAVPPGQKCSYLDYRIFCQRDLKVPTVHKGLKKKILQ